jgi:predicted Zn-dependent protease with MMP-like domain
VSESETFDDDDEHDEQLELALADIHDAFEGGLIDRAAELIDALAKQRGDEDPSVRFERAALAWEREGPESAIRLIDALLLDYPDFADAHYTRALACEEADDFEGMRRHFLEVLRLDTEADAELGLGSEDELDFIEQAAEDAIAGVPEQFRELLRGVPIVLEPRPHPDLVAEGFDPRSLGLFEGLEHAHQAGGDHRAPTRIVLFHANLLADFPDPEMLAEEIEITLLHEIGHFFGLDEDDVERLGLA